jgi:hypothetical protein
MSHPWSNVDDPTTYSKVSVSELRSLLRCSKQHDYAYRQGLVPAVTAGYFVKGKYLHRLMQHALDTLMDGFAPEPAVSIAVAREQIAAEHGSLSLGTTEIEEVDEQFRNYLANTSFSGVKVLEVEREFYADLGLDDGEGAVLLHGVIDGLVRIGDDLWLVEHKTAGRAWSQGQFAFDYQSRLYTAAVERLMGERPLGTIFNFFYPKRWEVKQVYTTPEESSLLLREIDEALAYRRGKFIIRQPVFGCNDCSYRHLCHAELTGAEDGYIRANQFTVDADKVARFADASE